MASNYVVKLINKTSESLTLLMPEPVRPVECRSISMAPASYVLFYGRDTDEEEACSRNLNSCLYHVMKVSFFQRSSFYLNVSTEELEESGDARETDALHSVRRPRGADELLPASRLVQLEWECKFLQDESRRFVVSRLHLLKEFQVSFC